MRLLRIAVLPAWSTDGGTSAANKRAIERDARLAINFDQHLRDKHFAEVNRLKRAHVGDVLERVFDKIRRSAALPLASVPNSLSMPSISELLFENAWMI
jgi:hypothetical protein